MGPGIIAVGAAAVLLLVIVLVLGVVLARSRTESRDRLEAARAETAALRDRVESLDQRLDERASADTGTGTGTGTAYVFTDAGGTALEPRVPDRMVLGATLGEPLVKVAAFGHGVRRALSAQSRNRIWFEVRREVRSSRRSRRRENKELLREARAARRAA